MGALPEELGAVIARAQGHPDRTGGREFWSGQWHGQDFVAVLSRIGKVAAASTAALLVQRHQVDAKPVGDLLQRTQGRRQFAAFDFRDRRMGDARLSGDVEQRELALFPQRLQVSCDVQRRRRAAERSG